MVPADKREDEDLGHLRGAVELMAAGQISESLVHLQAIDQPRLRLLKSASHTLVSEAVKNRQWKRGVTQRRTGAISLRRRYGIYFRDGWTCQWAHCQRLTVAESVMRLIWMLAPDEFPWQQNWRRDVSHPMLWTHTTQLEHIVPSSGGGSDSDDNLTTVCSACQYSKGDVPAHVLGWTRTDGQPRGWDGLVSYLGPLVVVVRNQLPEGRVPKSVLEALKESGRLTEGRSSNAEG
jgi:hypothetical protein